MSGMPENRTELGNARRLVHRFGDRIRFVHAWRRWLVFQQGRWMRDETGELERLAKETVIGIYQEAHDSTDATARQQLSAWAAQSERARQIRAMLELAASEPGIPVRPADLDRDPMLLNVANGTLDLRTGQLRAHDPADLITRLAPVRFESGARCPRWLWFLDRIFGSDAELIRFVQRLIGYILTGQTGEQCLAFFHGKGANGKTTLLKVLAILLGDYAASAAFSTLAEHRGDGPRNDLARLAGARLVTASELNEGMRLDEGLVKILTGGDTVAARFLYGEHFEFTPAFMLVLSGNHKPQIRGTDHAIWRRIHLVPFNVTIPEPERDLGLVDRLAVEGPGILQWALEGCLAWQRERLAPPAVVQSATSSYRNEQDTIGRFLDECATLTLTGKTTAAALYQRYKDWCAQSGERPVTQTKLGTALGERGLHKVKSHGTVAWVGVALVPPSSGDGGDSSRPFSTTPSRARGWEKSPKEASTIPTVPGDGWEPEAA